MKNSICKHFNTVLGGSWIKKPFNYTWECSTDGRTIALKCSMHDEKSCGFWLYSGGASIPIEAFELFPVWFHKRLHQILGLDTLRTWMV